MDRELLLEIGCEELPASWLPSLTDQIGDLVSDQLTAHRLTAEAPAETYSTPRRLTVRIARVTERQTDLEEVLNGPPVSAGFKPDGTATPAALGFAARHGVDVVALERVQTPKGEYLAFRKRQRGKAAVDVLPAVLGGVLRGFAFPKAMHWDAMLEDGRGDLLFGRPIRWVLFLYGGRVVPFTISRTAAAQSGTVQDVPSGAVTYGHRFLTTSGRAGRAIKVRSFDEYRARLLENFVILERSERHNKIARELDAKAQRLQGRVSRTVHSESGLLHEVPDLVEYPSVIAGTFAIEFLELPAEVLTTTLIHHQHYFPVESEEGKLKNAFLAVINTEPDNERTIARNAERVVTARLRDARFFWKADRKTPLESRINRLGTLLFHKKLGTYKEKAERIERLAEWIALEAFATDAATAQHAARAARLAKADLTTDMVREFPELQGTMGGIYAREEGMPEEVWKAIYFHYLPVGVEADAPPSNAQLGKAAVTWVAVSLADKLDTIVGLFAAGEKPTGSRDPYGLRRAAQGVVKILVDLPAVTGLTTSVGVAAPIERAFEEYGGSLTTEGDGWKSAVFEFLAEREQHLLERRGLRHDEIRAVMPEFKMALRPHDVFRRAEALSKARGAKEFEALAVLFKRVKNITKDFKPSERTPSGLAAIRAALKEPAEYALLDELQQRWPKIEQALQHEQFLDAMNQLAHLQAPVDRFFVDVLVMAEDQTLREARLALLATLRDTVLQTGGDISEIAPEETKQSDK
ncbi:MAG TPA: glycine--tRNA ligase subunit beta [Vicinamibacterales bacterium]|nr:glycine--tRNA ligase subunit beta [Vicinamibacterales bacterium]